MTQARTTTANETVLDQAKKLGDDLVRAGTSVFHAGLGVVATTEEQARKTFERMVDKGREYGSDDNRLLETSGLRAGLGGLRGQRLAATNLAILRRIARESRRPSP